MNKKKKMKTKRSIGKKWSENHGFNNAKSR